MLPEMNGQEVLQKIRAIEKSYGIRELDGVKIIMTTMLSDFDNIKKAVVEQREGYLIKPVTLLQFDEAPERFVYHLTHLPLSSKRD
jgi:response regulator of citrate/malate metabolism